MSTRAATDGRTRGSSTIRAKEARAKARQREDEAAQAAFGRALADAMGTRGMTQLELGTEIGVTQSAVSSWRVGDAIPDTRTVFAVERALDLPPGQLSRHLGYYPPDALKKGLTVEAAVVANTVLDDDGKRVLLAVFRELTAKPGSRRGRPRTR